MITRGHYIGEIVDELSTVENQIAMRSKLGLYDLNVYSESFFKDVLNAVYGWNLKNLNSARSNEPGLDLGDEAKRVAIQVTSRSDARKINDTLSKITDEQAKKFKNIYVLILGEKKSTYKLNKELSESLNFNETNILDVQHLCRIALDLPINRLQDLHEIIRTNVAKLLVELEIADPKTGRFPTNGFDKWEQKPEPKVGNAKRFAKWYKAEYEQLTEEEIEELRADLENLGQRLRRLPRVTREFLVVLFERNNPRKSDRFRDPWKAVRLAAVEREYGGRRAELMGELALLSDEDFVEVNGEDPNECGEPEVGMCIPGKSEALPMCFLEYVNAKSLDLREVLGRVDLSAF